MFQGWTKTGWTLDHSISFCVCALRTIEPLQSDSRLKTNRGNQRWHTAPFDIQRAAYITCINGFGQDWCKRVCWQAAISCPTVSFVRFLRRIFALLTSAGASRLQFLRPLRVTSCPPRQSVPIATEMATQRKFNILLFLMGLQRPDGLEAHTHTRT